MTVSPSLRIKALLLRICARCAKRVDDPAEPEYQRSGLCPACREAA